MVAKTVTKVIGTIIETTATFKDFHNVAIDPNIVTLTFKRPSGVISNLGTTKTGLVHTGKILLDESGPWFFRWSCDGEYASAIEFKVNVEESTTQ